MFVIVKGNSVLNRLFNYLMLMVVIAGISSFASCTREEFISVKIGTKTWLGEDRLRIRIGVSNQGNVAAHNIKVYTDMDGKLKSSKARERLDANERYKVKFYYDLKLQNPGSYPLVIRIKYTDANHHHFSATAVHLFDYKEGAPSKIVSRVDDIKVSRKGKINISLKNPDDRKRDVSVRLITSRELTVSNSPQDAILLPHSENNLEFDIRNSSALEGSNYPCFAVIEYDADGRHFSSISSNKVRIVPKKWLLQGYKWHTIGLAVALLIAFVTLQFVCKK